MDAEPAGFMERGRSFKIELKSCLSIELLNFKRASRFIRTKDLISAENQLLHYYEEYRKSDTFKEDFEITSSDNIYIGGIIIGQKSRPVKPNQNYSDPSKINSLYTRAINCRKEHFYKASRIDFIIWDRILDLFRSDQPPSQESIEIDSIPGKSTDFSISDISGENQ